MVFYSLTHNSTYVIQVGHTYYRCAYYVSKHCQRQRKIGSGTTATLRWRLYTIVVEHHRIYDIIIQYNIILTIIAGPAGRTGKREQKTAAAGTLKRANVGDRAVEGTQYRVIEQECSPPFCPLIMNLFIFWFLDFQKIFKVDIFKQIRINYPL